MSTKPATEEQFKQIFGPLCGPTAYGICLCLLYGDELPKEQYAGVRVEEVREVIRTLQLGSGRGDVT